MARRKVIRQKRRRARGDVTRQSVEIVFWLVLALALSVGGQNALSGMPGLIATLLPTGMMAAEAGPRDPAPFVQLPITVTQAPNAYSPQVLTPLGAHGYPAWLQERVRIAREWRGDPKSAPVPANDPTIAIVIDDLGADWSGTRRAIALPKWVTLSFLPYPDNTPQLARAGTRAGHEIILHLPMEPLGNEDPGPMALTTDLNTQQIDRRLDWALSRVPGISGVNNHMGSRFTMDARGLVPVMETLADRHLFFFDSMTTPRSEAVRIAHAFGVQSEGRDVFLDDVQTPNAVRAQLRALEAVARREGIAIAIGHPHDVTLDVLAEWCRTAAARGYTLVPLKDAIRIKTRHEAISQVAAK